MDRPLDPVMVRVLGSLIEKELTTPDNYPLTLNALTAACNQTSNRDPVMVVEEATVLDSLEELARRSLVRAVQRGDARTKRYRHLVSETLNLHPAEVAVLCVLLLRGAQTAGEIRTRTSRMFEFRDLPHVELTVQSLMTLSTPLVVQLPRQPGQKEVRYAHLLSGEPQLQVRATEPMKPTGSSDRVAALEQEVELLRAELTELRNRFDNFRRAFE